MGIFEAVILGLVQGLTEFLPISSSAHLRIVGELFRHLGILALRLLPLSKSEPSWRSLPTSDMTFGGF